MTEHPIDPPPDAPPPPGFFDRVADVLHHGEEGAKHAAQVIEGDAVRIRAGYLEHAAAAHELAALVLRALKDADPALAATLGQIAVKALPVAETAARIAGAVLKVAA